MAVVAQTKTIGPAPMVSAPAEAEAVGVAQGLLVVLLISTKSGATLIAGLAACLVVSGEALAVAVLVPHGAVVIVGAEAQARALRCRR